MQITCQHCMRAFALPDEKVPAHPFALNCPACKGRIEIDPAQHTEAPAAPAAAQPAASAAAPAAQPAAAQPAVPVGPPGEFEPLPNLRELDQDLLANLYPAAALVDLRGDGSTEHYEAGLQHMGMETVQHFDDIAEACEVVLETEFAVFAVLMEKATAPPCEPLEPLYKLPLSARRGVFVALLADNVRSLDGQTAFYLQVNCLINAREIERFPLHLRKALLFHLRQYRFWDVQEE